METAEWASTYDCGTVIGPDVQFDEKDERIFI